MIDENCFQRISFKEVSFEDGSLEEPDESLAHSLAEGGAGTNSFPHLSFTDEDQLAAKEAETSSFFTQSFSDRILSLRMCLRIFLFSSFQLICAALLLGTCSFTMSFPKESLQSEELVTAYFRSSFQHQSLQSVELVAAYFKDSFQQQSLQQDELEVAYSQSPTRARQLQRDRFQQTKLCSQSFENMSEQLCSTQLCRSTLDSFDQLDLEISLSLTWLGSTRCRTQLQATTFARSSFEHRALPCAALLYKPRISTQLQNRSVQSFQLTRVQLSSLAQGGVQHRTSRQPALHTRVLSTALTLISLSLALDAWLKASSKRAWRRKPLSTRSSRRSSSTRASPPALATSSTTTAKSNLRRALHLVQLLDKQHLHWQQLLEKTAC